MLINDTIGFIRDLPPDLIAAFSSTLEDSIESDILLHVMDAGDAHIEDKRKIVEDTLTQIGATQRRILVMNKTDTLSKAELDTLRQKYLSEEMVFVSAYSGEGIEEPKRRIQREIL